jgi:hypothetical protein
MPARRLSEILGAARELNTLAESARRIAQLQRIYLEVAPPELAGSSRVSWSGAGVLTITAGNGAVASKLRQVTPRMLDHFRERGFEFNSMRIRVQVGNEPARNPQALGKRLSPRAVSALEEALAATPESPLKHALHRLAGRR